MRKDNLFDASNAEVYSEFSIEAIHGIIKEEAFGDEHENIEEVILDNLHEKIETSRIQIPIETGKVNVTLSIFELLYLNFAIETKQRELKAKKYIRQSLSEKIKPETRWLKVVEIMGLKKPGKRLRRRGYDDMEICLYWCCIENKMSAMEAAKSVFSRFKFNSQETCNKWLCDEISRHKKAGHKHLGDLPKPSKSCL